MNAIWGCRLVFAFFLSSSCFFHNRSMATHLHAADTQCKADTQVVTVGPFDREDGVGDEKEEAKR